MVSWSTAWYQYHHKQAVVLTTTVDGRRSYSVDLGSHHPEKCYQQLGLVLVLGEALTTFGIRDHLTVATLEGTPSGERCGVCIEAPRFPRMRGTTTLSLYDEYAEG